MYPFLVGRFILVSFQKIRGFVIPSSDEGLSSYPLRRFVSLPLTRVCYPSLVSFKRVCYPFLLSFKRVYPRCFSRFILVGRVCILSSSLFKREEGLLYLLLIFEEGLYPSLFFFYLLRGFVSLPLTRVCYPSFLFFYLLRGYVTDEVYPRSFCSFSRVYFELFFEGIVSLPLLF